MMAREILSAQSSIHSVMFREINPAFHDLRVLPQDIYLRPRESRSGCALFILPHIRAASSVLVIAEVGGVEYASMETRLTDAA